MADYYVDQRNDLAGDGSQGNPWKDPTSANAVALGSVVNFVPGSGIYRLSGTAIRVYRDSVTWDLNGCEVSGAIDLNDGAYEWHKSTAENQYYCTLPGGINPNLVTVKSCEVDGYINDEDKGIGHAIESSDPSNWRFGDYDFLGFSTLYVKWWDGSKYDNPANGDFQINAAQIDYVFWGRVTSNGMKIKNGTLSGSNEHLGFMYGGLSLENVLLKNSNDHALDYSGGDVFTKSLINCHFKSCGHRAFLISDAITLDVTSCLFDACHLVGIVNAGAGAMTLNFYNNIAWNMDAGIFSIEGSTATINEDYNCLHVNPDSPHAGRVFNYEIGATLWTSTGVHSLPPSAPTDVIIDDNPDKNGIDPVLSFDGRPQSGSPCIGTGNIIPGIHDQPTPATDIDGQPVLFTPNMGPYDGRTTEIITEANYAPTGYAVRAGATLTFKGGGAPDLSGLTDTGKINCKLSGEIDGFTPNGAETKLKASGGQQRIFGQLGYGAFGEI